MGLTLAPMPRRMSTRPSFSRAARASRTGVRLTLSRSASWASLSSSPVLMTPLQITFKIG